jgi:hypothetical protein
VSRGGVPRSGGTEWRLALYTSQSLTGAARGHFTIPGPGEGGHGWAQGQGQGGGEPDGQVLVWSMAMQQRPEYNFICQSPVLTARFHDFNSHIIIG